MTGSRDGNDMTAEIRKIDGLLQRRQLREARTLCDSLLMRHPDSVDGWLLAARIHQLSGDYGGMLDAARRALAVEPSNNLARFTEIEARMHAGRRRGGAGEADGHRERRGGRQRHLAPPGGVPHPPQPARAGRDLRDPRRDPQALRRPGRLQPRRAR